MRSIAPRRRTDGIGYPCRIDGLQKVGREAPSREERLLMMKPMTWNEDGVRAECLGCGAHTMLDWDDYLSSIGEGRKVWCSTCANFHPLIPLPGRILGVTPEVPEPALHESLAAS
jgi:hypothetical protein